MEKIKNVLLQLSSNGSRMTGEIERQRLQSKKASNCTLVIFRFVRLNSCTLRQLWPKTLDKNLSKVFGYGLQVRKTESSGLAVFTSGHSM